MVRDGEPPVPSFNKFSGVRFGKVHEVHKRDIWPILSVVLQLTEMMSCDDKGATNTRATPDTI